MVVPPSDFIAQCIPCRSPTSSHAMACLRCWPSCDSWVTHCMQKCSSCRSQVVTSHLRTNSVGPFGAPCCLLSKFTFSRSSTVLVLLQAVPAAVRLKAKPAAVRGAYGTACIMLGPFASRLSGPAAWKLQQGFSTCYTPAQSQHRAPTSQPEPTLGTPSLLLF